jgi:hypothetical protein
VDTRALERAFGGLSSQRLSFDRCDVRLRIDTAIASCSGNLEYVRRIGQRDPQRRPVSWVINLQRADDVQWLIAGVDAR